MSTTTKNYSLIKPELTDAADITAMNENWDKIDNELHQLLPLDGSRAMTGDLKLGDGTGHLGSTQGLTILSHDNADGTSSYIVIYENTNTAGSTLKYVTNGTEYRVFGEHNLDMLRQQLSNVANASVE